MRRLFVATVEEGTQLLVLQQERPQQLLFSLAWLAATSVKGQALIKIARQLLHLPGVKDLTWGCYATDIFTSLQEFSISASQEVKSRCFDQNPPPSLTL